MQKQWVKIGVYLAVVCLGFPLTEAGDWLQDMTNNARKDLQRQGQRATGGTPQHGGNTGQPGSGSGWGAATGGYTPGMGAGPARYEGWYVYCNTASANARVQGSGHLQIAKGQPFGSNYVLMNGPHNSEPVARNWITRNCPGWRCNWNGACSGARGRIEDQTFGCGPGEVFVDQPFGQGYCRRR